MRQSNPPPPDDATVILRRATPPAGLPLAGILRGVSGDLFGKQFPIRERLLIGRDERCDVVVPYPEVSRQHVRLEVNDGRVMLHDLGSANGTLVNGTRVTVTELRNGDDISFHTVRFRFEVPGALSAPALPRFEPDPARAPAPVAVPRAPASSMNWLIIAAAIGVVLGVVLLLV